MRSQFNEIHTPVLVTAYKDMDESWWLNCNDYHHPEYKSADLTKLPAFLAERLAVLQIANQDESIGGVGMRVNEKSYWLYIDISEVPDDWVSARKTQSV